MQLVSIGVIKASVSHAQPKMSVRSIPAFKVPEVRTKGMTLCYHCGFEFEAHVNKFLDEKGQGISGSFVCPRCGEVVHRGWLSNQNRRERRLSRVPLSKDQAQELIDKIDQINPYTKLDPRDDELIRLRDKAMISIPTEFDVRGGEVLSLKRKDVRYNKDEVQIHFTIEKKRKSFLVCADCRYETKGKGKKTQNDEDKICKHCGHSLKMARVKSVPQIFEVDETKTTESQFAVHIINWVKKMDELLATRNAWLFPRYNFFSGKLGWETMGYITKKGRSLNLDEKQARILGYWNYGHLSIPGMDMILQRLDPSLTSHIFRYGITKRLALIKNPDGTQKYSLMGLKSIGHWVKIDMPAIYLEEARGGNEEHIKYKSSTD